MIAIASFALWMGAQFFTYFVMLLAAGVMWEWTRIVGYMRLSGGQRLGWLAGGMVYIGWATASLLAIISFAGLMAGLVILATVWATDIGAYFAGRLLGGPKIAPLISPSKTWAGLIGGMAAATLFLYIFAQYRPEAVLIGWPFGPLLAALAQGGDFFESWMKRRAGIKDSSKLIPGHGGLFDRLDGLLPLLIFFSLTLLMNGQLGLVI